MKFTTMLLAGAMVLPATAFAQTAPAPAAGAPAAGAQAGATATAGAKPTVGATIYDTAGGVVGTVDSITPQGAVVISTGTVKAAVPGASIGTGAKGPTLAMTKAQLEAAAGAQQATAGADFKAKLVPGAQVVGSGGSNLGTIKAADAQFVTLTTARGDVKLPVAGFGPSPTGGVALGMTSAQLDAAMGKAGAPAAGATTTSSTTTTTTAPATDATAGTTTDASTATTAGTPTDASAGAATTTQTTTTTKKTTKKKR